MVGEEGGIRFSDPARNYHGRAGATRLCPTLGFFCDDLVPEMANSRSEWAAPTNTGMGD